MIFIVSDKFYNWGEHVLLHSKNVDGIKWHFKPARVAGQRTGCSEPRCHFHLSLPPLHFFPGHPPVESQRGEMTLPNSSSNFLFPFGVQAFKTV